MPAEYIVNSEESKRRFHEVVDRNFEKSKYHKYSCTSGRTRKLTQNALFQVWARELIAYFLKKPTDLVSEREHEDVKKTLKSTFYQETGHEWMLCDSVNYFTGEKKKVLKSSAEYERAQMYEFLEWVQARAVLSGLILEAKGEFQEMKQGDFNDSRNA